MATFLEGVGDARVACTLVVIFPAVALVLVARHARLTVVLCYVAGASLLAWARAADLWHVELDGVAVPLAAALAAATYILAYRCKSPASASALAAGAIGGALSGWFWQPCVGPQLGDILNNAMTDRARTLALMTVYMSGALLAVVLLALAPHAFGRARRVLGRVEPVITGAAIGAAYVVTLAIGRYDDVIGELYRIASGA